MKTVTCPSSRVYFIVFSDYIYDMMENHLVPYQRSDYEKYLKTTVIYYKILKNITQEELKIYIDTLKNNSYLFSLNLMNIKCKDMDMEEHELYLQLNGYTKYENS